MVSYQSNIKKICGKFEDVKNIMTFQLSNYLLPNDFNLIIDFLLFMN